jgi:hypothetical protein
MTVPSSYSLPASDAIRVRRNHLASLMDNHTCDGCRRLDLLNAPPLAAEAWGVPR